MNMSKKHYGFHIYFFLKRFLRDDIYKIAKFYFIKRGQRSVLLNTAELHHLKKFTSVKDTSPHYKNKKLYYLLERGAQLIYMKYTNYEKKRVGRVV
jgi:hypothetical protein